MSLSETEIIPIVGINHGFDIKFLNHGIELYWDVIMSETRSACRL